MYMCHNNQRRLRHTSLNIIVIVSNILMKHHIEYENVWTNDAVHYSKTLDYIKCSNCLRLVPILARSVNRHRSIA